ncbi:TonB-dependent receptor [Altererythrobacter atlanticus]|uniref:Catecholate siderophore receptor CirA n=1 Tax=Croceibacterium atlanticum TaxID=1267766 RepID=A0A0F7KYU8_9SPHN|nr:TonB-dependent receptor [Croceibacterium atlanticum]AKH43995.1 catecholate siderophore receptor CirA [Croceibacterium atlanticum]MBB5732301.1 TonB-dependent receptor [Croceibacterium atlanticum]
MKLNRLLLSTSAAACALAATPALAGEVVGVVVDTTDTISLQSANIRLVELNREAVSERDGSFRFPDVPAGTYTLVARYVGAKPQTLTIDVPGTGTVRADFALGGAGADGAILVIGQSANQASALSRKRESDVVSDVLSRDAIGQFPDQNVAESLRRLPGINVLNDQGEGRFVSVRGLDPNLNSTSLNGVRVPSPESDVRSVALDVISSDIIESIEVKKSLTPDMDADTIGASIEIETTSAFDRRKSLLTGKLEGSYNDYSGELTPKGSVDFATRLGENVGVSGGISYYKRKFETDNIETDGWEESAGGPFATEIQYRDYDVERERISATLGFDFRVGDSTELYVKGIYSQFDDQEYRRRTTFDFGDFEDDGPSSFDGATAIYSDADQEFTVERDVKDRFESQKIRTVVAGGKTEADGWTAEYSASWAKSSEKEDGSLDPIQFERDFEGDGLDVIVDYSDARRPLYSVSGSTEDFFDAGEYELNDIEFVDLSLAEDEEYSARFDLGREFWMDAGSFTVQAGFKGRWRSKSYAKDVTFYENDDMTLADALGEQTYRIANIGPVADKTAGTDYFYANIGDFEIAETDTLFDSAIDDYSVDEDIMAGYLLGRWDSDTLRVIGGLRYEHTDNQIRANEVLLVEEDGTLPNGDVAEDDTVIVSPTNAARSYEDWLPSLNIRWSAQQDLILRLAGYKSLVRPKLSKLPPRFSIEENDEGERQGEFGNPDLKPYKAWNFDASLEYYLSSNGAISAAVFYKDVKNFIYDINLDDPGVYRGIAYDEATIPFNGESGEIYGLELSYSQAFSMLPEPLDGLLLQANYTYTDATGLVPTDGDPQELREVTLPSTSKHTGNIVLGFDKGPFDIRLSGTYRSKYLDELGDDALTDRIVDDHFQLDLSAKYRVTENIKLYYEWVNINDAKYFAYNTLGGQKNNYQFERYKWTMKFGVRVNF